MRHRVLAFPFVFLLIAQPAAAALTCALTPGAGAVKVVKASGGDFATPGACLNAITPGQICEIQDSGSYAGTTITNSGSGVTTPLTLRMAAGQTATISGAFTVSNRSYLLFYGLTFSAGGIYAPDDQETGGPFTTSFIDVCNNTFTGITPAGTGLDGIGMYGANMAFEYNTGVVSGDHDFVNGAGANYVFRGNFLHNMNAGGSGTQHSDMNQIVGGNTTPQMNGALFENNFHQSAINNLGNVHTVIARGTSAPGHDNVIIRYMGMQNLDAKGPLCVGCGSTDIATHFSLYHNTSAEDNNLDGENGSSVTFFGTTTGHLLLDSISYNETTTTFSPYLADNSTGVAIGNGDVVYNCTPSALNGGTYPSGCTPYAGSWPSPYSGEATYATNHNVDPGFSNYPTDLRIPSNSNVASKGVPITTVAAGDSGSGTTLVLNNSYPFFVGWGNLLSDQIVVGVNPPVRITANNPATGTLTLASSISRSAGDAVHVYSISDGTVVWFGSEFVGACPAGQNAGLIPCGGTAQGGGGGGGGGAAGNLSLNALKKKIRKN
jgi:hypothetical protein